MTRYQYLPRKYLYTRMKTIPEDAVLSTCALCGRVFYIPKSVDVKTTCFCEFPECQKQLKEIELSRRISGKTRKQKRRLQRENY